LPQVQLEIGQVASFGQGQQIAPDLLDAHGESEWQLWQRASHARRGEYIVNEGAFLFVANS